MHYLLIIGFMRILNISCRFKKEVFRITGPSCEVSGEWENFITSQTSPSKGRQRKPKGSFVICTAYKPYKLPHIFPSVSPFFTFCSEH